MSRVHPLVRINLFEQGVRQRCATRIEPMRWGRALFNDGYPLVWDLNFLTVEEPADDVSARGLAEEAERLQGAAGLGHRKVAVDDEALGHLLAAGFARLGWAVRRFVAMTLNGKVQAPPRGTVKEFPWSDFRSFYEASTREQPIAQDEEVVRQLTDKNELFARAVPTRYFGAVMDGRIVSGCQLMSDGGTAQIEDVATLLDYRRRGLATGVVLTAAAATEGDELVFLVADEEDWPKEMYRKLGFRPAGLKYDFIRSRPSDLGPTRSARL